MGLFSQHKYYANILEIMIPSTTNRLLVTENWTKIYQSFRNADFKSYDFETLRRTMILYLRERYPEDFNDYIESSEYIALIDLIAFLGQNLSFRIDLNARENFLETAERRDSVLRLARLINYNSARNVAGNGFLKVTNITTTDNVVDSNGINLSNTIVTWNDATNDQWYQQFISIINNSMPQLDIFGKPQDRATVDGILTEQYRINSTTSDVPVYSFNKAVNGTNMNFEIVSSIISGNSIVEEPPRPANQFGIIYKNDNRGAGSSNTGFFVHFRQGTLSMSSFTIDNPVPNEIVGVNAPNINDNDVWLWQINSAGNYDTLWDKVSSLVGNNVIYNSISSKIRSVYAVLSREQDQIDLSFADGSFGDLPKGQFKLFYRQSNGLNYVIKPENLNNITVVIPYSNKSGQKHELTLTLSLKYTVTNASAAESIADIKLKAPQTYYTQNRMVTAEDYNISPLSVTSDILKLKSINRVSSGVSRYFELSDVSGKYSKTNIFADDGVIYKEDYNRSFQFTYTNRNQVLAVLKDKLGPVMRDPTFRNFYYENYNRVSLTSLEMTWKTVNKTTNQTAGYIIIPDQETSSVKPAMVGSYTASNAKFIVPGSMIKFKAPANKYFLPSGKLTNNRDGTTTDYWWAKVINVIGDGANNGIGGTASIILAGYVADGVTLFEIIPKFVTTLSYAFELDIVTRVIAQTNFGLSYKQDTMSWFIIEESNLNSSLDFSLANQENTKNQSQDASWMVCFLWDGKKYVVKYHSMGYIFESQQQTAFYVDPTSMNYDFTTNTIVKDKINVLSINTNPINTSTQWLGSDYAWQIDSAIIENDGYVNPKKVQISFYDETNDGQLDDPDSFDNIVKPMSTSTQTGYLDKFVYFYNTSTSVDPIIVTDIISYPTPSAILSPVDSQLYYFYDDSMNSVMSYSSSTSDYTLLTEYTAKVGRSGLKFQYTHNSGDNRRIDPSKMNLIDIYILSKSYDSLYRNWLATNIGSEPLPPTSQSLANLYSAPLEKIKTISDELIYQPAKYRILFGSQADTSLQAIFKVVRNSAKYNSDNDLKSRILTAISDFFNIDNWDFGQSFYFSELATYVMNRMTPDITNFVIVPAVEGTFGNLYEITCKSNEIFISGVTVNDIEIVTSLPLSDLRV